MVVRLITNFEYKEIAQLIKKQNKYRTIEVQAFTGHPQLIL